MTDQMVGETLKKFRKKQKLTLKQLAEKTGISTGYISKIERENANPSMHNIQKLCYALGITANELMTAKKVADEKTVRDKSSYVIRKSEHAPIYGIANSLMFDSIFEGSPHFKLNVMTLVAGMEELSYTIHAFDEFGIVTKGILGMTLNDQQFYELREGDCILIRANTKHTVTNRSSEECISYWIEICNK